jgi:hypothetical protein
MSRKCTPTTAELLILVATVAGGAACAAAGASEETEVYQIEQIVLPATYMDAERVAFDLDGDGNLDNAGGAALTSMFRSFESASELLTNALQDSLDRGRVSWEFEVDRDLYSGDVLAVRSVDPTGASNRIPASILSDILGDSPVTWAEARGFVTEFGVTYAGQLSGRLGFALAEEELTVLIEPVARFFTQKLLAGELLAAASMDVNQDGVITAREFMDSELVRLLLQPDVNLDGDDDRADSWSVAFGIKGQLLR